MGFEDGDTEGVEAWEGGGAGRLCVVRVVGEDCEADGGDEEGEVGLLDGEIREDMPDCRLNEGVLGGAVRVLATFLSLSRSFMIGIQNVYI